MKADQHFMSEHPDFHPKTLCLRIDIRWNALYAQLQSIYEQKDQIEMFVDSVQHLRASDKIPVLDAEYWTGRWVGGWVGGVGGVGGGVRTNVRRTR